MHYLLTISQVLNVLRIQPKASVVRALMQDSSPLLSSEDSETSQTRLKADTQKITILPAEYIENIRNLSNNIGSMLAFDLAQAHPYLREFFFRTVVTMTNHAIQEMEWGLRQNIPLEQRVFILEMELKITKWALNNCPTPLSYASHH